MMLFGITDVLDAIPGVTSVTDYIAGKAKAGAEQAIPDIQSQVKSAIEPYIIIALLIGGTGLLIGISALRKKSAPAALSGRRR